MEAKLGMTVTVNYHQQSGSWSAMMTDAEQSIFVVLISER